MTTERTPAFWRIISEPNGKKIFHGRGNTWSPSRTDVLPFMTLEAAELHLARFALRDARSDARIIPVYVTVKKKRKSRDFGWAFRQMQAGKKIKSETVPFPIFIEDGSIKFMRNNRSHFYEAFPGAALAATDWELIE